MRRSGILTLPLAALLGVACGHATKAPAPEPVPVESMGDTAVARIINTLIGDHKYRTAEWGVLIDDVDAGTTLYAHDAGRLMVPASNLKIVTASVAAHILGPDYRFGTTIATNGSVTRNVLHGDLLVLGTGDPTMSDRIRGDGMQPLRQIADSLYRRGVRKITGKLVSALDAFPDATRGTGWMWNELEARYAAGIDELFLNDGVARILVKGGARAGDSVKVTTRPARTVPRIKVQAQTQAGGPSPDVQLLRDVGEDEAYIVTGTIAPGDTADLYIPWRNPVQAWLAALKEALTERGITVEGAIAPHSESVAGVVSGTCCGVNRMGRPVAVGRTTLFTVYSPPLKEILHPLEKNSVNQIAETLFKTVGRVRGGSGTYQSGIDVVRKQLLLWGAPSDGFVIYDGSGLSRLDLISPETLVKVLTAMRSDPAFPAFFDALPVSGIDGTLGRRMSERPARGNVHAKTGTMVGLHALSGYITAPNGHTLVFSIMCNNATIPDPEIVDTIDEIVTRVTSLKSLAR